MQPHQHPPMTPRHRVFLAVTVLSFLTVIGLVIGCDSDDGPKVTAPAPGGGGGGNGTPTRNMTAEQQGRDGLEETENGTMIRNKGDVALNVRFNYDDPRHYRLNADTAMPSDPANAGSAPARVACGVPATGRANGQCFNNDGVTAPEPYSSNPAGNGGGGGRPPIVGHPDQIATSCIQQGRASDGDPTVRNNCGTPIVTQVICGEEDYTIRARNRLVDYLYETLEDALWERDQWLNRQGEGWVSRERNVRDEGLAAYAVDDDSLAPGQETSECSVSQRIIRAEACYLRESFGVTSGGWYAYAPTFEARDVDINTRWNCFIRSVQASAIQ